MHQEELNKAYLKFQKIKQSEACCKVFINDVINDVYFQINNQKQISATALKE
jgi:hypothetical protein